MFGCDLTYAEAAHLDKALIVAVTGTSPRKGDLFSLAVGEHFRINKLTPIVGVQAQQRKREQLTRAVERLDHRFLVMMEQGETFCPSSCYIGQGERRQICS